MSLSISNHLRLLSSSRHWHRLCLDLSLRHFYSTVAKIGEELAYQPLKNSNGGEKVMSLDAVTAGLKKKIGEDCGLGAILKFDFGDDGHIVLDATQVPNVISSDDIEAQCTMALSLENFMLMAEGKLDGTMAFMSGKLKIQGDMGIAMKLGPLLA
jgi:putative sterol carrier protein